MKLREIALAGVALVGFALPAAAQTEFYIVQDVQTKQCRIVTQRPVTQDVTIVSGNGVVYHSQTEAMTAMKTVQVCTTH